MKLSPLKAAVPGLFELVDGARIEVGYAWGLHAPFKQRGFKFAVGAQTGTLPLGFTYSGLTLRLTYQWLWLEPTLQSLCLDVVLH